MPVNAQVVQLEAASGHADASGLLAWLRSAPEAPRGVFVVHGEPDAADALRRRIAHELGWRAQVPEFGAEVDLTAGIGTASRSLSLEIPGKAP